MKKDHQIGYFILRLTLGFNFFLHGLVRVPKLEKFSAWMLGLFQDSYVPAFLVKCFSMTLPFVELIVGLLIIFGLLYNKALQISGLVVLSLICGSCLIEKWDLVSSQMVYALFVFALIYFNHLNIWSLDKRN